MAKSGGRRAGAAGGKDVHIVPTATGGAPGWLATTTVRVAFALASVMTFRAASALLPL